MIPKKTPAADLTRKWPLLFLTGLTTSLFLAVVAFESSFQSTDTGSAKRLSATTSDELLEVPPTEQPPPPPTQKVQPAQLIEVPNEEKIIEEVAITFDQETAAEFTPETAQVEVHQEEEETDQIFLVVESEAEFKGGRTALVKFVSDNLKYPAKARRMGIEGKVFLAAVIEKDGAISNVQVLKGIGAGCDEEAVRIVSMLPNWIPARQRGRPVRSRITVPIVFALE